MTEEEYFKQAGSVMNVKRKEEVIENTDKPKKTTRTKKQTKTENIVEQKELPKPVYNVSRNEQGETTLTPQATNTSIKTINQINNEIENNAIDNKYIILKKMIDESYEQLTRIQIEIEVAKRMYELYNREMYQKQIKTYQDNLTNVINRIRVLNELKEEK